MSLIKRSVVRSLTFFVVFELISANESIFSLYHGENTLQKISKNPYFAGFYNLIKINTEVLNKFVEKEITIFIPTNEAILNAGVTLYSGMGLYHMALGSKDMQDLRSTTNLSSVDKNLPKLWISMTDDNEIFVNNAKIVSGAHFSNSRTEGNEIITQSILSIDRVLDAGVRSPPKPFTAHDIFGYPEKWDLDETKSVSTFWYYVQKQKLENLFTREGGSTYFIPIDKGITPQNQNDINEYSIKGHVVPNIVLFTRPTQKDFLFETSANNHLVYMVSGIVEVDGKFYVKSRTVFGTNENPPGDYLVEIIQSDIPVANGVVHLISDPLGTHRRTLKPFPYTTVEEKLAVDLELSTFYDMAERHDFLSLLKTTNKSITLFVPNDYSWQQMKKLHLKYEEFDADLLKRHLIIAEVPFTMERLYAMSSLKKDKQIELQTSGGLMKVFIHKKGETYYIQWYNKLIKVLRPNYECSDGIIHVIAAPIASLRRVMTDGCC